MKARFAGMLLPLILSGYALGQMNYVPVVIAFPQVAFGGNAEGQYYVTLLHLVNNNSMTVTGRFELRSNNGEPVLALFDGQGPMSAADISLLPGEARVVAITSTGELASGWLKITYSPSDALTAVILQFRSGTTLLSEVGVDPLYKTTLATDFAIETDPALNTGIALANPGSSPLYVKAKLWNGDTGLPLAETVMTLPPNGHIATFVTDIFSSAPGVTQTRARVSLDSCSDASCAIPGTLGFLGTALRLNRDQFTVVPIVQRPTGGDPVRVLPQVAFGGPPDGINMRTILYLTTNAISGVFGTADILDNDGNAVLASADGAAPSSSIPFAAFANRVTRIVLSGDDTLRSGWIRLRVPEGMNLVTNAVFQTFSGSQLGSEAGVLETPNVRKGLVQLTVRPGTNIGVALANSQPQEIVVAAEAFDQQGVRIASHNIVLPQNGHIAVFVTSLFPELAALPEFSGTLSLHSASPFSALALRLTGDKVATLPVATNAIYRPSISSLRVTQTTRVQAAVNFSADVSDLDGDLVTNLAPSVALNALLDFGAGNTSSGSFGISGVNPLERDSTLVGSFQPSNVSGVVPEGTPAVLYIQVFDSQGNISNVVGLAFRY